MTESELRLTCLLAATALRTEGEAASPDLDALQRAACSLLGAIGQAFGDAAVDAVIGAVRTAQGIQAVAGRLPQRADLMIGGRGNGVD